MYIIMNWILFISFFTLHNASALTESTNICGENQFACSDGRCILLDWKCNGEAECIDGSDESLDMCNGSVEKKPHKPVCILPSYPAHGTYKADGTPTAKPRDAFEAIQLRVTCEDGFALVGSENLNCSHGQWSEFMPKCVHVNKEERPSAKNCILPPYPAHGYYDVDRHPSAKPGDAFEAIGLKVTCNDDHALDGIVNPICYQGIWSNDMPNCIRLTIDEVSEESFCLLPPYPAHGYYKAYVFVADNLVTVAVRLSKMIFHEDKITKGFYFIEANKEERPSAKSCILPPYPAQGYYDVYGNPSAKPGDALEAIGLKVTCNDDHALDGIVNPICYKGIWSNDMPKCIRKTSKDSEEVSKDERTSARSCILPPYPAHGSYVVDGPPTAKPGDTFEAIGLNVTCDDGFALDRVAKPICYHGLWSEDIPKCVRVDWDEGTEVTRCILPPYPAYGTHKSIGFPSVHPDDAVLLKVKCNDGYFLNGSEIIGCYHGKWPKDMPLCYQIGLVEKTFSAGSCRLPPYPAHGSYVVDGPPTAKPGDAFEAIGLNVTCDYGYARNGVANPICYHGQWSEDMPKCIPKMV